MNHIYKNGTLYKSEIIRYMHLKRTLNAKLNKYSYSAIPLFSGNFCQKSYYIFSRVATWTYGTRQGRENHTWKIINF